MDMTDFHNMRDNDRMIKYISLIVTVLKSGTMEKQCASAMVGGHCVRHDLRLSEYMDWKKMLDANSTADYHRMNE
jgi:hypothetical protein